MTEEEAAADRRTQQVIDAYLSKPVKRRPQWSDHAWSSLDLACVRCGITQLHFAHKNGVPCQPR